MTPIEESLAAAIAPCLFCISIIYADADAKVHVLFEPCEFHQQSFGVERMNYYQPRQRESDKRFDYTNMRDQRVWPIGYCHAWEEFKPGLAFNQAMCDDHNARYGQFKEKYHTDGHATYEEACECYRRYLLDNELRLQPILIEEATEKRLQLSYCEFKTEGMEESCGVFTANVAMIAGTMREWSLCTAHLNRESVETLFSVGQSVSSY